MKENFTFEKNKAKEFFMNQISFIASIYQLKNLIENDIENINIVDVRKYDDYLDGHIPYAIHVPYESIDEHYIMFEKEKINIIYCYDYNCKLGYKAAYKAAENGFPVMVLNGGFHAWKKMDYDIVRNSADD